MRYFSPSPYCIIFFFFAIFGLPDHACTADDLDNETCLTCHESDQPVVDRLLFKESVHGQLNCVDCHDRITEIPHDEKLPAVDCSTCHKDEFADYAKSIHGHLAHKNNPDVALCKDCHGTHDILDKKDPRSMVNHFRIDQACLKCHTSAAIIQKHPSMPSEEFINKYKNGVHGQGVTLKGLTGAATCVDCHDFHKILPASDPASTIFRDNIVNTCKNCHLGIYADFEKSIHGRMLAQGMKSSPTCTTCHNEHGVASATAAAFKTNIPNECGECHHEKTSTYTDTFHGKATSLGYIVAAKCSDCHTAHKILPEADPDSSVNPAQLKQTCSKCHANARDNFIRYQPHLNPHDKARSPIVYYVYQFMQWLLTIVFGFWGIHTLMWLQRSIVAMVRKEFKHAEGGRWHVRRFARTHRLLHVVIIVSFLGLAATGLPLKFHGALWAKMFGAIFGGIESSRLWHRLFAIMTFGYAAVYIGMIVRDVFLRRRTHILGGPDSLMPRAKDLTDLWDNIKWFLYIGKPPRFDRWTYFEKFDFFAVFWGVPVIGFSGLVMWFPDFFSRFFPGTFINIATIIHSDEALLAIGFIFIFHFFHNHMRPENFPIELSLFSGTVPLERFKRERPAEYERLRKEGRLKQVLAPAPSARTILKCKIFAFTALIIGTILILAIFFAYILK